LWSTGSTGGNETESAECAPANAGVTLAKLIKDVGADVADGFAACAKLKCPAAPSPQERGDWVTDKGTLQLPVFAPVLDPKNKPTGNWKITISMSWGEIQYCADKKDVKKWIDDLTKQQKDKEKKEAEGK
jgi:hypothetical protein